MMFQSVVRYLVASPLTDDQLELDQLFQTILERRVAILIAPISTVPLAFLAAHLTGAIWPWVWMPVDLLLTGMRWKIMVNAEYASDARRRQQAKLLVLLGALWMLALGIAIYLCLTAGHAALMVVSAVIGTGVACTVTSRNAATPRHALLLLVLLGVPFGLGMMLSPLEDMFVPAILTIVWIASLYTFVLQNHASTLRLIKAESSARQAAQTDQLTGLFNRMYFEGQRTQLEANTIDEKNYCFLCIDLDGFKAVNDNHGHAAGDAVLRDASRRMQNNLRQDDLLFRLGGDEFVALLVSADPAECNAIADRLINALAAPFELADGTVLTIGASIGSACTCGSATGSEALLNFADAAMYRAKANGKGIHVHA